MDLLSYMNNFKTLLFLCISISVFTSCKSEYQQYVDKELGSGIKNDSLFLGMYMGQTKKEFFARCWDLNAQQMISQGTGNKTAKLIEDKGTPKAMNVLFYGKFDEQQIMRGMDMTYSFEAWAPWNRPLQSDSLLFHIRDGYLKRYPGNEFLPIEIKNSKEPAFVKIDGNRQILMYAKNEKEVVVAIEDLNYKLKEEWGQE